MRDRSGNRRAVRLAALGFVLGAALLLNAQSKFPNLAQLQNTNVSLELVGIGFGSGLRPDAKGQPNGNGLELLQMKWAGSGFIVGQDGTIVTNYHVARRAQGGRAYFEDGSSFDIIQIKAYDPLNDLAILKLRAQKAFSTVKMGNSDAINVMDKVLAVGNALGQRMAVTEGMINQVFQNDNSVRYQLRHSAIIAPGNSGGALYRGSEVVGVNVAGIPGYSIYYSIPVNLVKPLLDPKFSWVALPQAFPADIQAIVSKAKQIFSQNGQVPAAVEKKSGQVAFSVNVRPLQDILFVIKSPGRDLALMAAEPQQGQVIGFADSRVPDAEMLLLDNANLQKIVVYVMNYDNTPANFALAGFHIQW